MSIEAMKQALEYIKATNKGSSFWMVPDSELNKTVNSLRQAIEQAEKQEPVAWVCYGFNDMHDIDFDENEVNDLPIGTMLYTHPQPKREWVGLTDEEIFEIHIQVDSMQYLTFGKAIEAKLKQKNGYAEEKNT